MAPRLPDPAGREALSRSRNAATVPATAGTMSPAPITQPRQERCHGFARVGPPAGLVDEPERIAAAHRPRRFQSGAPREQPEPAPAATGAGPHDERPEEITSRRASTPARPPSPAARPPLQAGHDSGHEPAAQGSVTGGGGPGRTARNRNAAAHAGCSQPVRARHRHDRQSGTSDARRPPAAPPSRQCQREV